MATTRSAVLRRAGSFGALFAFEVVAVVVLTRLGSVPALRIPWHGLTPWLLHSPVQDVLAAVLRTIALLIAWWLLGSNLLYVLASLTRAPSAVRAVRWLTLPVVRRATDHVMALTLATSLMSAGTGTAIAATTPIVATAPPRPGPVAADRHPLPYTPRPAGATIDPDTGLLADQQTTTTAPPATYVPQPAGHPPAAQPRPTSTTPSTTKPPATSTTRPPSTTGYVPSPAGPPSTTAPPKTTTPPTSTTPPRSTAPQTTTPPTTAPRTTTPPTTTPPPTTAPPTTAPPRTTTPPTTSPPTTTPPSSTAPPTTPPPSTAPPTTAPRSTAPPPSTRPTTPGASSTTTPPTTAPPTTAPPTTSPPTTAPPGQQPPPAPQPPQGQPARSHRVVEGDNLWTISRDHLAAVTQRRSSELSDHEIATYWLRVIAVNRSSLRSGDPDVIFPGELIMLPPIAGA